MMSFAFSKKQFLALFLAVVILGCASAQDNSLLWKVSGKGLEQSSYLFGTIHVICKADFRMDERISAAFAQSDKVVMELDMSDPELSAMMQQISMNPGMKNISADLDSADAKLVNDFLTKNYGAGLAQLGVLKPFVLSTMVLMKTIPCEELESYEASFTAKAIADKKPIMGLETPEFQIGIFDQIPAEIQLSELIQMLHEDSASADFQQMIATYQQEDIEKLYEQMNADGMMAEYRALLLDDRNKTWVSILEKEMKTQKLFVAVGAGHLGGENGLIVLLRKAGYQVDPIRK